MLDCSSHAEAPPTPAPPAGPAALRTDTLADGFLILLSLAVVQRLVGFCRAILFCRWLDPEQLGLWDMAFGFLLLAAPLSVLALHGAFPRYAEYYLKRQQFRTLLKRTAAACTLLGLAGAACVYLADRWFSQFIFGSPDHADLVAVLALALLGVIAMNYFVDLFSALRNVRLMAGLQLANSLAFAALGIGLLLQWQAGALSVIVAYGASCAFSGAGGVAWLARNWQALPGGAPPPPHRDLWARLLPFAAWTWLASMLANLFAIADRYMIVHCSRLSTPEALAQVGDYHTSRVLPTLLVSVTLILSPLVTAHLSHDWEAGRNKRVAARLNLILKLFGLALTLAAVAVLVLAPVLFRGFFQGKYSGGLVVLPWTLTYCVWFSMFTLAGSYLLCHEKAYLASVALLAGLIINVGLNLLLLPRLGLLGAVLATSAANLAALLLVAAFNRGLGFGMDRGTYLVLALPALFWLGPWATLAAVAALALGAHNSKRILSSEEKAEIGRVLARYVARLRSVRVGVAGPSRVD